MSAEQITTVGICTAKALYDFAAEDEEELGFAAGEEITVLEKDEAFGDGWWRGRAADGRVGLFPFNYVAVLVDNTEPLEDHKDLPTEHPDADDDDDDDHHEQHDHDQAHALQTSAVEQQKQKNSVDAGPTRQEDVDRSSHPRLDSIPSSTADESDDHDQILREQTIFEQKRREQEKVETHQQPVDRSAAHQHQHEAHAASAAGLDASSAASNAVHATVRKEGEHKFEFPETAAAGDLLIPSQFAALPWASASPISWSVTDVEAFLTAIDFADLAPSFKENDIDGETFLQLNQEMLKELGVKSLGKRIKLLNVVSAVQRAHLNGMAPNRISMGKAEGSESGAGASAGSNAELGSVHSSHDGKDVRNQNRSRGDSLIDDRPRASTEVSYVSDASSRSAVDHADSRSRTSSQNQIHAAPSESMGSNRPSIQVNLSHPEEEVDMMTSPVSIGSVDSSNSQQSRNTPSKQPSQATTLETAFMKARKVSSKTQQSIKSEPPAITADLIQDPDFVGWLTKQGGAVKSWKRRWFVLKDYIVYYFKSPRGAKALGMITLPSYLIETAPEIKKKFAFKATHPSGARPYYFLADTFEDMRDWMSAMNSASQLVRKDGLSPANPDLPRKSERRNSNSRPQGESSTSSSIEQLAVPAVQEQQQQQMLMQRPAMVAQDSADVHEQIEVTRSRSSSSASNLSGSRVPPPGTKRKSEDSLSESKRVEEPVPVRGNSFSMKTQPPKPAAVIAPKPAPRKTQPIETQGSDPSDIIDSYEMSPSTEDLTGAPAANPASNSNRGHFVGFQLMSKDANDELSNRLHGLKGPGSNNRKTTISESDEEKNYVNWINSALGWSDGEALRDICRELQSGVILIRFLEKISGKTAGKFKTGPVLSPPQQLDNLSIAFRFMSDSLGVNISRINPEDIFRGDRKKVLGLMSEIARVFPISA